MSVNSTIKDGVGDAPRGLAANEVAAVRASVDAYIRKRGLGMSWRGGRPSMGPARKAGAPC